MFRILLLLAALAAGGTAAWLSTGATPAQTPGVAAIAPAPENKMQEVLVAAVDLEQGKRLTEDDVQWQSWPDAAMNRAFIRRSKSPKALETLMGSVVRSQIIVGEPIREEKLANSEAGFLSAILAPGRRAVAVRVTAENTAGGFILPNDRVDVIHTMSQQNGNETESVSRTILANIRVLAIDQRADDTQADASAVGKTATLELEPLQVEVIAAAEASGSLSLALRSTADNNEKVSVKQQGSGTVRIVRAGRAETVKTR